MEIKKIETEELRPLTQLEEEVVELISQHNGEEASLRKKLLKLLPHKTISLEDLKKEIVIIYGGVIMKWDSVDELVDTIYCKYLLEETSYIWLLFESQTGNFIYKVRKV